MLRQSTCGIAIPTLETLMARHLKWYEVLGGFAAAGLTFVWLANRDSPAPVAPTQPTTIAAKPEPRQMTIRSGSVICFTREDWEAFKSAAVDNHLAQLKMLLESGKCQQTSTAMTVTYLDPVSSAEALVQTPGGRGAIVFLKDTE